MRTFAVVLYICAILAPGIAVGQTECPGPDGLDLSIGRERFEIVGATPLGELLIYGVQRDRFAGAVTLLRRSVFLEVADEQGDLTVDVEERNATSGTWLVVDTSSGRALFGRPSGKPVAELERTALSLSIGSAELDGLVGGPLDVIAVQGTSFGSLVVADGSELDRDDDARSVGFSLGDLLPLGGRGDDLRSEVAAGDQYFVIDSRRRTALRTCIGAASSVGTELVGGAR